MKKFIAVVLLTIIGFTGSVQAADFCDGQRDLAEQTMSFRQSGGSRAELDAVVYSEQGQAIADMAFARGIVPEGVKSRAVKGFGEYVEGLCRKNYKPKVAGDAI